MKFYVPGIVSCTLLTQPLLTNLTSLIDEANFPQNTQLVKGLG